MGRGGGRRRGRQEQRRGQDRKKRDKEAGRCAASSRLKRIREQGGVRGPRGDDVSLPALALRAV